MVQAVYTICCIAQTETDADPDPNCTQCGGHLLEKVEWFEMLDDKFEAEQVLVGAGLIGYRFDPKDPASGKPPIPGDGPHLLATAKKFIIPFPEDSDYNHLCVFYNREGDPRINIVAVEEASKSKFRPLSPNATAEDNEKSPIANAAANNIRFDLSSFPWGPSQPTELFQKDDLGAWTIAPDPAFPMSLTAKKTLYFNEGAKYYNFVRWEMHRLSQPLDGEAEEPTIWDTEEIEFDTNTYAALIAYYKQVGPEEVDDSWWKEHGKGGKHALPTFLLDGISVLFYISDLARGIFQPLRHAPGEADHGRTLPSRELALHEREKLAALAQAHEEAPDALTEYLTELHQRES